MSVDKTESELDGVLQKLTATAQLMVNNLLAQDAEAAQDEPSGEWTTERACKISADSGPLTIELELRIKLTDRTPD